MADAGTVDGRESNTSSSSTRATNDWARPSTTTSPRRTTMSLDGLASRSTSDGVAIYDRQLLWQHHGQRKLAQKTLELLNQENVECTFAPKINRTHQTRRRSSLVTSVASPTRRRPSDGESWDCSSQYSDSPRTVRSVDLSDMRVNADELVEDGIGEVPLVPPLHPTESQESSILLHLARQERAREEAHNANRKLVSVQPRKDFTKVTTARPFSLSVSNRKDRRSTSESPKDRFSRPQFRSGIDRTNARSSGTGNNFVKRRSQEPPAREEDSRCDDGSDSSIPADSTPGHSDAPVQPWEEERRTLLAIIETQRQALEARGNAQQDAARVAETFAGAIQTFEARIENVEKSSATELSEMKSLLAKQMASIDLLLHALGLDTSVTHTTALAPPSSNAGARKETK